MEMALTRSSNQDELQEMIARGASLLTRTFQSDGQKGAAPLKR
jgi:hypothetical protein